MHREGLADKHIADNQKWVCCPTCLPGVVHNVQLGSIIWTVSWCCCWAKWETIQPAKTCDTRCANSKCFVFTKGLNNLPTVAKCLQDIQIENRAGSSKDKEKTIKAATLEDWLINAYTLIELACFGDIWSIYGDPINVCQTVNVLPCERLKKIDSILAIMDDMPPLAEITKCAISPGWGSVRPGGNVTDQDSIKSQTVILPVIDCITQIVGLDAHTIRSRDRNIPNRDPQQMASDVSEKAATFLAQLHTKLQNEV